MAPPIERFRLATQCEVLEVVEEEPPVAPEPTPRPAGVMRWVDKRGLISLAGFTYRAGRVFSGEPVEVVCHAGLVEVAYKGVATHAQRLRADDRKRAPTTPKAPRARVASSGMTVTRIVDGSGSVSFAGATYRAGRSWIRSSVQVAIVGTSVQLSVDGKVIRVHPIRHDRSKEHGAFATPNGRPRKAKTA